MNWTRVFVDIFFLSVTLCCISISQLITSCKLDFNHKGVLYYRVIDQTFRLLPHVVENQGLHRPCFSVLSLQGLLIWVAGSRPDPEAHTESVHVQRQVRGQRKESLSLLSFVVWGVTSSTELHFRLCSRGHDLWPCHGGSCPEPRWLLLLQHREGVPVHRGWRLRAKVQPGEFRIRLPGWLSFALAQI